MLRTWTRLVIPLLACGGPVCGQEGGTCIPPFCVSRTDDNRASPVPGMLRYAVRAANDGATIVFDPALKGQTIVLDGRAPGNHLKLAKNVTVQGLGSNALTISGENATRIFFVDAANVRIHGVTLANGLGKGGDGSTGFGGGGGGGGSAGMGGAVFLNHGSLLLDDVVFTGNRAVGGNGGSGGGGFAPGQGGGGGSFSAEGSIAGSPGAGGDLTGATKDAYGIGGVGGKPEVLDGAGSDGGWGAGGGGGAFILEGAGGHGFPGGGTDFGGGSGGGGGFLDPEANTAMAGGGGQGGSGLGGAIFVRSGRIQLHNTVFLNNSAAAGLGAAGAPNGIAKGGAIFVCSQDFCGSGHAGTAVISGKPVFQSSGATDAGTDPRCWGRDDPDVCGRISENP